MLAGIAAGCKKCIRVSENYDLYDAVMDIMAEEDDGTEDNSNIG